MTPDQQISAWKTTDAQAAFAPNDADSAGVAPHPAADAELPSAITGAGGGHGGAPMRSEYLLTVGCCQGITSDVRGCAVTGIIQYCNTPACINPETLVPKH